MYAHFYYTSSGQSFSHGDRHTSKALVSISFFFPLCLLLKCRIHISYKQQINIYNKT